MRPITRSLAALLICGSLAAPAFAMEAVQKVEREYTETLADGSTVLKRASADLVKPGENIVYSIAYTNTQAEAASGLVLDMPVPDEVRFAEGSADRAGAVVSYSTDGGQSFTDRLSLSVVAADGTRRPATTDDITDVRWTLSQAVVPGESGTVEFKGRLR